MKAKEFDIKKRDPNWRAMQDIRRSGAGGQHKDKKKAAKQGEVKHKGQMAEQSVSEKILLDPRDSQKYSADRSRFKIGNKVEFGLAMRPDSFKQGTVTDIKGKGLYLTVKTDDGKEQRLFLGNKSLVVQPLQSQDAATTNTKYNRYKVGDRVEFGIGIRSELKPATVIKVNPRQSVTVKADDGEEKELTLAIKSLRLKPLTDNPTSKPTTEGADELYGIRIGDTVTTEFNGREVQGDVIDLFPDDMQVELLLRGPESGRTIVVDVRDTEFFEDADSDEPDEEYLDKVISDLHKDALGFRPDQEFGREWMSSSFEEKLEIYNNLLKSLHTDLDEDEDNSNIPGLTYDEIWGKGKEWVQDLPFGKVTHKPPLRSPTDAKMLFVKRLMQKYDLDQRKATDIMKAVEHDVAKGATWDWAVENQLAIFNVADPFADEREKEERAREVRSRQAAINTVKNFYKQVRQNQGRERAQAIARLRQIWNQGTPEEQAEIDRHFGDDPQWQEIKSKLVMKPKTPKVDDKQNKMEGIGGTIAGGVGQFIGNKIDPLAGEIMRAHGEMAGRKAEYTIRKYMHLLQKALKQQLDSGGKSNESMREASDFGEPREILEDVLQTLEREVEWPLTEVMDPREVKQLLAPIVKVVNDKMMSMEEAQDDWGGMSHREFKRRELQHELGHEDDPEFQRQMREKDRGPWYIRIDGKIYRQKGEPKVFDWKKGANNYALAIVKNRPELKDKTVLTRNPVDQ